MSLRSRIKSQEKLVGTLVSLPSPENIEILCEAGFDWFFFDLEHSALDASSALTLLQTLADRIPALIRVESKAERSIRKALDIGAAGIIVPQVNDAKEAKRAVSFAKYPPDGSRGVGLGRACKYGADFKGYLERANNESIVIVQIESREAVENIDEILAVDQIDGVLVGPYDLSGSLGKLGAVTDPEVCGAIEHVLSRAKAKEVAAGIFAGTAEVAKSYSELGFTLLVAGTDALFLLQGARAELAKL